MQLLLHIAAVLSSVSFSKSRLLFSRSLIEKAFDSIFERLCLLDIERSKEAGLPEQKPNEAPFFQSASVEIVKAYMVSQFYYWTEDETACNFRKMLTLEQYRNPAQRKVLCADREVCVK